MYRSTQYEKKYKNFKLSLSMNIYNKGDIKLFRRTEILNMLYTFSQSGARVSCPPSEIAALVEPFSDVSEILSFPKKMKLGKEWI